LNLFAIVDKILQILLPIDDREENKCQTKEAAVQLAKDKFKEYFITKPCDLLKTFPPEDDPAFWSRPQKRQPRGDMELSPIQNALHAEFIESLALLYDDEEFVAKVIPR
jgi:hypothetical protein